MKIRGLLLSLFLLIGISLSFGSTNVSAEVNIDVNANIVEEELTQENEDVIDIVESYTYLDDEGNKRFNIEGAQADGVEDYIIEIGYIIESFDSSTQNVYARATFLIYGNYCGYGNSGKGKMPTDDLDTACMYHDYCYVHGGNNTQCNKNFRARLKAIMNNTSKLSYKYAVAAGAYVVFG